MLLGNRGRRWVFVPAILGFIDGLNFIFMSDKTFRTRYEK